MQVAFASHTSSLLSSCSILQPGHSAGTVCSAPLLIIDTNIWASWEPTTLGKARARQLRNCSRSCFCYSRFWWETGISGRKVCIKEHCAGNLVNQAQFCDISKYWMDFRGIFWWGEANRGSCPGSIDPTSPVFHCGANAGPRLLQLPAFIKHVVNIGILKSQGSASQLSHGMSESWPIHPSNRS